MSFECVQNNLPLFSHLMAADHPLSPVARLGSHATYTYVKSNLNLLSITIIAGSAVT